MIAPVGIDQIRAVYGDPRPFIREDGGVSSAWEKTILTSVELPDSLQLGWDRDRSVTRIRVNVALVDVVERTLGQLYRDGLWKLLETFDGCYCWRPKRTSGRLSLHAWGAALDFNAAQNPIGWLGCQDERLLRVFRENGWTWGGQFTSTPDPMHWQFASGY